MIQRLINKGIMLSEKTLFVESQISLLSNNNLLAYRNRTNNRQMGPLQFGKSNSTSYRLNQIDLKK